MSVLFYLCRFCLAGSARRRETRCSQRLLEGHRASGFGAGYSGFFTYTQLQLSQFGYAEYYGNGSCWRHIEGYIITLVHCRLLLFGLLSQETESCFISSEHGTPSWFGTAGRKLFILEFNIIQSKYDSSRVLLHRTPTWVCSMLKLYYPKVFLVTTHKKPLAGAS